MTLKEIAQKANVSISTVSRVINQKNTKAASQEVQERIWEIVRESGNRSRGFCSHFQCSGRGIWCITAFTHDFPDAFHYNDRQLRIVAYKLLFAIAVVCMSHINSSFPIRLVILFLYVRLYDKKQAFSTNLCCLFRQTLSYILLSSSVISVIILLSINSCNGG